MKLIFLYVSTLYNFRKCFKDIIQHFGFNKYLRFFCLAFSIVLRELRVQLQLLSSRFVSWIASSNRFSIISFRVRWRFHECIEEEDILNMFPVHSSFPSFVRLLAAVSAMNYHVKHRKRKILLFSSSKLISKAQNVWEIELNRKYFDWITGAMDTWVKYTLQWTLVFWEKIKPILVIFL